MSWEIQSRHSQRKVTPGQSKAGQNKTSREDGLRLRIHVKCSSGSSPDPASGEKNIPATATSAHEIRNITYAMRISLSFIFYCIYCITFYAFPYFSRHNARCNVFVSCLPTSFNLLRADAVAPACLFENNGKRLV